MSEAGRGHRLRRLGRAPSTTGAVELGLGLVASDWDTEFDRCIDLMLAGLAARLAAARADHA